MKCLMTIAVLVLTFKSFVTIGGAIAFYEDLGPDAKQSAQIVTIPDRRRILGVTPYRVYYEETNE